MHFVGSARGINPKACQTLDGILVIKEPVQIAPVIAVFFKFPTPLQHRRSP